MEVGGSLLKGGGGGGEGEKAGAISLRKNGEKENKEQKKD